MKGSTHRMTTAICVALGVVVVVAAGVGSTAHFTGPRWVPDLNPGVPAVRQQHHGLQLPRPARPAAGNRVDAGAIVFWVGVGVAVVGFAALAWWLWRRFARRLPLTALGLDDVAEVTAADVSAAGPATEPEPEAPVLRNGIEEALLALDDERQPTDAVVRAWLGLQQAAEQAGVVRAAAETPTEFTTRIMARVFADDSAIKALLALYLRARFGDREVSADDVTQARAALERLARAWDASVGAGARQGAGAARGPARGAAWSSR